MKKIFFYAMMLVACTAAFSSCSDDNDSNPTLIQPTEFVLNTPSVGDGLIDLQMEINKNINLSWSQPKFTNFGAPVIGTYSVQVSTKGTFNQEYNPSAEDNSSADFVTLGETYSSCVADVPSSGIAKALMQLNGWTEDSVPEQVPVYIRVKAAVQDASFNEYGTIYSNVVKMNVIPYYVELKPAAPIIWYMVGDCIGSASWSNDANGVGVGLVPLFLVPGGQYDLGTGAGVISFTGYFPENGQFKFVQVPGNWEPQLNFTQVKNPAGFLNDADGDNHNVQITQAGYYTIEISTSPNVEDNAITITKYEESVNVYSQLCIAGTFNEWSDSDMTPVFTLDGAENHIWSYNVKGGDKLKVKIPGSWDTCWGYKQGLAGSNDADGNLVVPDGNYLFIFNDITGDYMLIEK